jgi:serine/threonine protein kinase
VSTTPRNVLLPGHLIQWYEIREVLGHGGFGITYLATDTNLKQNVAVKEFFPTEFVYRGLGNKVVANSEKSNEVIQWALTRFIEEGQTLARFDHPSIVRVIAVFEANDTAYLVMRYENGEPLSTQIPRRKGIAEEQIWPLIDPLLKGLELVHQAGFIHRDIKPANIFIREDGSPVLLDFGSAREAIGEVTRTLTTLVSPGYAPIEQYQQEGGSQGPWTDIYGMAATLYRCAFGISPVEAVQRSQSMLERGVDSLVSPTDLARGSYSSGFCEFVSRGLALNPGDRPRSITEWRSSYADHTFAPTLRLPGGNDTALVATENMVPPAAALRGETESTSETAAADIDGLPPEEKEAITPYLVFGILSFGSYTAWKFGGRLAAHVRNRSSLFSERSSAVAVNGNTDGRKLSAEETRIRRVQRMCTTIYALAGCLYIGWTALALNLSEGIFAHGIGSAAYPVAVFTGIVFYLNTVVFAFSMAHFMREHERSETLRLLALKTGSSPPEGGYIPDFVERWEKMHNEMVFYLVTGVPICAIPVIGLIVVRTAISGQTIFGVNVTSYFAPLMFIFALALAIFHYWGIKLIIEMLNAHFRYERTL